MELLIGDKTIGTPVRWHLASVAVSYQANEDGPQSVLPSALADVQKQFQPKPEIVHIQRAPGKSPPRAISLLFTVFSLLPLLCLFYTLQLAGANLKVFCCTAYDLWRLQTQQTAYSAALPVSHSIDRICPMFGSHE